ncbi:hypothetical protein L873DRAFT_1822635 [Choiromyces venosus 120613-1]|uniref:Uncharacterized protein n=1 Tax=Choiromyces venosus 120613-1 TaxID=1336337 RepID=A0A3N4ITM5_9PEZI|nr:hypothetical protein L873DRAFT_1822635 [Choiromyces venosus 120613-1]
MKFSELDRKVNMRFDQVSKKFDALMMLIIGGAVLKGGYEIYKDERRHSACRKEL